MTSSFPTTLTALPQTSTARHMCFNTSSRRRICSVLENEINCRGCTDAGSATLLAVLLERALYIQNFSLCLGYFEAVSRCLYQVTSGVYDDSIKTKSAATVAAEVVAIDAEMKQSAHVVESESQPKADPQATKPDSEYYANLLKTGPDLSKNMVSDKGAATAFTLAICCRKCKSAKITFNQKQTRSADEAMTVFCQCSDCLYRWKM